MEEVRIPQGLLTDLASVPRGFRGIVGRVGPHLEAAIVHDFMYGDRVRTEYPIFTHWTRKQADQLFLAGMKKAGVGWALRHLIYRAVRIGGGRSWRIGTNTYHDKMEELI